MADSKIEVRKSVVHAWWVEHEDDTSEHFVEVHVTVYDAGIRVESKKVTVTARNKSRAEAIFETSRLVNELQ